MAPEQLEGRVLTLKADVWAVGINLWEFATQKLPWAEEAMRESPNGVADYEYCLRKVAVCLVVIFNHLMVDGPCAVIVWLLLRVECRYRVSHAPVFYALVTNVFNLCKCAGAQRR